MKNVKKNEKNEKNETNEKRTTDLSQLLNVFSLVDCRKVVLTEGAGEAGGGGRGLWWLWFRKPQTWDRLDLT